MASGVHQCFFRFTEDGPGKSTMVIYIPQATTPEDALDFVDLMVNALDPLVQGGIQAAGVTLFGDTDGHGSAGSLSDVEEKGQFNFVTELGNKMVLSVPTFDEDLVVSGSKNIDVGQVDVAAWLVDMLTGIAVPSTNVIAPTDSRGEDLVSQSGAVEKFRGR